MDRREFSLQAAGLAGALALSSVSGNAAAQIAAPVEGRDYNTLAKPVAVPADGRIHVIEFFWYGCPHCFVFEPSLAAWTARQPVDVAFRRVPVAFDALKETHQRVFYTWEALGLVGAMHRATFERFQTRRQPIDSLEDMLAFAQDSKIDPAKVRAAWNSFGVQTRCREARRLVDDYQIDRTPEMAIQGRFTTIGAPARMLEATDWLVNRVRARR